MARLISVVVLPGERVHLETAYAAFDQHGFDIVEVPTAPEQLHLGTVDDVRQVACVAVDEPVVLLTNVTTYLLAWFRYANQQANAFVLVADPTSPAFLAPSDAPLVDALATFDAIDEDAVVGRVFLHAAITEQHAFEALFRSPAHLPYLAPFRTFPFQELPHPGAIRARRYRCGPHLATVDTRSAPLGAPSNDIVVRGSPKQCSSYDVMAQRGRELVPEMVAAIAFNETTRGSEKIAHLEQLFAGVTALPALHDPVAQEICRWLPQVDRDLRPSFAYYLGRATRHPLVLKTFGDTMNADYLGSSLAFSGYFAWHVLYQWFKIPPYPDFYRDQRRFLSALIAMHEREVLPLVTVRPKRHPKRLLLLLGECPEGARYGPASTATGKARAFQSRFDDWSVALAITERHRLDPVENRVPDLRPVSARAQGDLRALLGDDRIQLILPDPSLPRRERSADLLTQVFEWGPQLVVSFSADRDPVRGLLFPHYPIIERAVGTPVVKPDDADVYLSYLADGMLLEEFESWGVPAPERCKYVTYRGMFTLKAPARAHTRGEYGLPDDALVVATVGYELPNILRDEVVSLFERLLHAHPKVHWALVGQKAVPAVTKRSSPALRARTHLLGPVEDLAGFFSLCDAVVAPRQSGGGIAHAMAMNAGVPVVIEGGHSGDIVLFAGNALATPNFAAFEESVFRAAQDSDYRERLGRQCFRALKQELASQHDVLDRFFAHLQTAEARFQARGGAALSGS